LGAAAGQPGRNTIIRGDGRMEIMPSKFHERLRAGDVIRIETPGGGGCGRKPSNV
jgi:N-methylhydantoinase B